MFTTAIDTKLLSRRLLEVVDSITLQIEKVTMTTDDLCNLLVAPPFPWLKFQEIFKFGDTDIGESAFDELVDLSLKICRDEPEREALLDLLGAQLGAFIDQMHAQRQFAGLGEFSPDTKDEFNWEFEIYQASAKIQVLRNARSKYGLNPKNTRKTLTTGGAIR